MGNTFRKLFDGLFGNREMRVVMLGEALGGGGGGGRRQRDLGRRRRRGAGRRLAAHRR